MTTTINLTLPKLHSGQQQVNAEAKRFNVLECGRRWGKTTFGLNKLVEPALDGKPVAWFAPTYKTMAEQWKDVEKMLAPVISAKNKVEQQIRLITGGVIDFWSLDDPNSGRGRKYARVIVDEASIIRQLEEAWQATIRPTLTDYRGDAWILGTPKGRRFFHHLYERGQQGRKGWASWRAATITNPFISPEEVADAERDLPTHVFRQEYLGIPADDGGNPFAIDAIQRCIMPDDEPVTGPMHFGVDLAKSQDWVWVIGLDTSGRVVVSERWQSDWTATRARVMAIIGDRPTLIDSTGVGDPIVEDIQKTRGNVKGFKFSSSSKQQLMEGLALAIQGSAVRYRDPMLVAELESFEYEYKAGGRVVYQAPQGLHDDGVCALALAVECSRSSPGPLAMAGGDFEEYEERADIWAS